MKKKSIRELKNFAFLPDHRPTIDKKLVKAIKSDGHFNLDEIQALIDNGANVNSVDPYNNTPFIWAVRESYPEEELVELLVKNGADVNAKDKNGKSVLEYLLEGRCISRTYLDAIKCVIDAGADVNYRRGRPLRIAMHAISYPKERVKLLVDAGADLNVQGGTWGKTPFMEAMRCVGDPDFTQYLIDAGADVNAVDGSGNTALMETTWSNRNLPTVSVLLKAGADVNAQNNGGGTALLKAICPTGGADVVKLLLDAGAEPNIKEKTYNCTPITVAAARGLLDMVKLLVEYGADINTRGAYSPSENACKTPLAWAEERGHTLVASYLRSVGARQ